MNEELKMDQNSEQGSTPDAGGEKGTLLVVALCGFVAIVGLIMMMSGGDKKTDEPKKPHSGVTAAKDAGKTAGGKTAVDGGKTPDGPKTAGDGGKTVDGGKPAGTTGTTGTGIHTVVRVAAADLEQMKLELPYPAFEGTPKKDKTKLNIDPNRRGKKRKPYVVPKGLTNIALKHKVASSDNPFIGSLDMVTDGDKDPLEGAFVELTSEKQWVQVDLGVAHDLFAVVFWHRHDTVLVYRDVVVQISDDPKFKKNVVTIFNNDDDDSSGFGAGANYEYYESDEGELIAKTSGIDAKGRSIVTESIGRARYIRFYSNGNIENEYNHYTEIEVFARPAKKAP
jgi:hypothetical protein